MVLIYNYSWGSEDPVAACLTIVQIDDEYTLVVTEEYMISLDKLHCAPCSCIEPLGTVLSDVTERTNEYVSSTVTTTGGEYELHTTKCTRTITMKVPCNPPPEMLFAWRKYT